MVAVSELNSQSELLAPSRNSRSVYPPSGIFPRELHGHRPDTSVNWMRVQRVVSASSGLGTTFIVTLIRPDWGIGEGFVVDVKAVDNCDGVEEGIGVVVRELDLLDEIDELGDEDFGV